MNRRQAGVPGAGRVPAHAFEMLEELEDRLRGQIADDQLRDVTPAAPRQEK